MAVTTAGALIGGAVVGAIGSGLAAKSDADSRGDAIDAQAEQNAKNEAFIRKQAQKARKDAIPLFKAAQANIGIGGQSALDVFAQTLPRQQNVFREGNIQAQKQILAGLPQIQNAILGLDVDLSALQPKGVGVDQSFIKQQVPNFRSPVLNKKAIAEQARQKQIQDQATASLGGQAPQPGSDGGANVPEGLRGLTREQILELNRLQSTGALGGGGFNLP